VPQPPPPPASTSALPLLALTKRTMLKPSAMSSLPPEASDRPTATPPAAALP
jgi:hypothetical protein